MTIARWGISTLIQLAVIVAWAVYLLPAGGARWTGLGIGVAVWLFVLNFFRNPSRTPQGDATTVTAAADGVVADIEEVDEPAFIGGRAVRVGIFLNVFNVHVNRSCIDGTIGYADYKPGKFLDARHPDVSHENEANTIGIEVDPAVAPQGLRILVRQLSGLIARRIICTHGVGDPIARGECYGMIKFGSRTEIWMPVGSHDLQVKVGDKVRCGETPIAVLKQQEPA